jgi:hypothetical protein
MSRLRWQNVVWKQSIYKQYDFHLKATMQSPPLATGDQLTSALQTLGVKFIMGRQSDDESLHKQPARLIAALAESNDARLRLSLIPLFLEHPEYAPYVRSIAKNLTPSARLTLQCYYSAAVWLKRIHQPRKKSLPDLFSKELNLTPADDPEENLRTLAKRQQELSGARVNWLGTYQHAVRVWLIGMEFQKD